MRLVMSKDIGLLFPQVLMYSYFDCAQRVGKGTKMRNKDQNMNFGEDNSYYFFDR